MTREVTIEGIDQPLHFPDDTPPEVIQATVKRVLAGDIKPKAPDSSFLGSIVSGAKAIGTGAAEGLAGATVALPKNLIDLGNTLGSKALGIPVTPVNGPLPNSEDVTGFMKSHGMYHAPANNVEKFLQAGASGVASMVNPLNPLKYTKGLAALGLSSGLTGEATDQMAGGNSPFMRALGNVAGMAPGALAFKTPQVVKAVQGTMTDLGPGGLEAAAAAKANADKTLGVNTLLTHQLPANDPLAAFAAEVARDPRGSPIRKVIGNEQAAMEQKAKDFVASLSPSQLGSEAENQVQKAGLAATYTAPEKARGSVSANAYNRAGDDYIKDTSPLIDAINSAMVSGRASLGPSGDVLEGIKSRLQNPKVARAYPNGVPVVELDNWAKAIKASGNTAGLEGVALQRARANQIAGQAMTDYLKSKSPALAEAKDLWGTANDAIVKPVQEGPLGKIFSNRDATAGSFSKQTNILSSRFNPDDVAQFAQQLGHQDPQAFPIVMKQAATDALDSASSFPDFVKKFAGTGPTKQRANVLEGVNQTALAHGMSPADAQAASQGANNLLDVFSTVGEGAQRLGPIDTSIFSKAAGESAPTGILKNVFSPFHGIGNAIESVVRGHTFDQLADIFTSPDGLTKLKEIAQYSPTDNAAGILGKVLQSTTAQQQVPE